MSSAPNAESLQPPTKGAPLSWLLVTDSEDVQGALAVSSFVVDGLFLISEQLHNPRPGLHPVVYDAHIKQPLVFAGGARSFAYGISFRNVIFDVDVDFSFVQFYGPAYFWGCTFKGEFNLSHATVHKNEQAIHGRELGEVNFSFCHFEKRFSCNRTVFKEKGYVYRTIFHEGASFQEARFEQPFVFEGDESIIAFPRADLRRAISSVIMPTFEQYMHSKNIAYPCIDCEQYLIFDQTLMSTAGLRKKFGDLLEYDKETFQQPVDAVCRCWNERFLHTMFADPFLPINRNNLDHDVSAHDFEHRDDVDSKNRLCLTDFRSAEFSKKTIFRNVDLSFCRFSGSNVSDLDFVVSYWAKQRCNPWLHRILNAGWKRGPFFAAIRYALRDELELDRQRRESHVPAEEFSARRLELSELYRELRLAYVREGDTLIGRDFFFGELEMARFARTFSRRIASMSLLYKILAGYSKQEGLALVWLLLFLVGFAGVYTRIDAIEHGILSRAQVSTTVVQTNDACRVEEMEEKEVDVLNAADAVVGGGNARRTWTAAVENSLEASTLVSAKVDTSLVQYASKVLDENCNGMAEFTILPGGIEVSLVGWESLRHLFEGVERALIIAQIALVYICLRSRFQRIN